VLLLLLLLLLLLPPGAVHPALQPGSGCAAVAAAAV
jgi:hypothetical protein